jgi:hypothetical protein
MNEGALTVDQGLTDYVRSFLTSVIAEVTKTK